MAINIKNREVETLLEEIKHATGRGPTAVMLELLRKEVERIRRARDIEERSRRIDEIVRRSSAKWPAGEGPTPDEIIGYDEDGLPT